MNPESKEALSNKLYDALSPLSAALTLAQNAGCEQTHRDLYKAVCDAYNACLEAISRVHDRPDQ